MSGGELWLSDEEGQQFLRLLDGFDELRSASWSADGDTIAVVGRQGIRSAIYLLEVEPALQSSENRLTVLSPAENELEGEFTSLDLSQTTVPDRKRFIDSRNIIGRAFRNLGEFDQAREAFGSAWEVQENCLESGCPAHGKVDFAILQLWQGDVEGADSLAELEQIRIQNRIPRTSDDADRIALAAARADWVRAESLVGLGRSDEAVEIARAGLRRLGTVQGNTEYGDLETTWLRLLNALGIALIASGNPVHAEREFSKAVQFAHKLAGERALQNETLVEWTIAVSNLAQISLLRGDQDEAIHLLREAVHESEKGGGERSYARNLTLLARALESTGELTQALREYERAEKSAVSRFDRWTPRLGLGRIHLWQGDLETARIYLIQSLQDLETVRGRITRDRNRYLFLASRGEVYERLLQLQWKRLESTTESSPESVEISWEALLFSESARARALLDSLVQSSHGVPSLPHHPSLNQNLRAGFQWLFLAEAPSAQEKDHEVQTDNVEEIVDEVASRVQRGVEFLRSSNTLLLEYLLGEEDAFLISYSDRARVIHLGPTMRIRRSVEELRVSIMDASDLSALREDLIRVRGLLLSPIEDALSQHDRILVVPDGILAQVPFELLLEAVGRNTHNSGLSLVSYAPSLAVYAEIGERHASRGQATRRSDLVALGHHLASADEEAEKIGNCFDPAERLTRRDASEERLREIFDDRNHIRPAVLHFATHAKVSPELPGNDHLTLAAPLEIPLSAEDVEMARQADGRLFVDEILGSGIAGDLVVLSACNTALGEPVRGEGIVGLSRAFLANGSSSVVASLWDVHSVKTSRFMQEFYRRLCQGATVGQALSGTKNYFRALEPDWRPRDWTGFILIGDPDLRVVPRITGG